MRGDRVTVVLGLVLFLSVLGINGVFATRRLPMPSVTRTSPAGVVAIAAIDEALAHGDVSRALMLWHPAYVSALYDRRWESLLDVGDARLRIERAAGFSKIGESRARELYRIALFRAKEQGSAPGVLRAAAAFDALGDHEMAAQATRIAATLNASPQVAGSELGTKNVGPHCSSC
jgi:hypothetical protein